MEDPIGLSETDAAQDDRLGLETARHKARLNREPVGNGGYRASMTTASSPGAFRAAFLLGGSIATAAGAHTMLAGARSLPGQKIADPVLESELGFYSAFYVGYGAALFGIAPHAEQGRRAEGAAAALLLAGVARALAWRRAGRPHPMQIALLAAELGLPPALLAWKSRLAAA